MDALRFFNPYAEIRHTENRLPHWQQENAVYFITFDWLTQFLRIYAVSGKASALSGFGCIPNLGALKLRWNITSASPVRSNAGWMRGTDRVSCGEAIARRSSEKRFVILTASVSY